MVLIKCMSQNYLILTVHGHNYAQLYVQIIFIVHVFLAYYLPVLPLRSTVKSQSTELY